MLRLGMIAARNPVATIVVVGALVLFNVMLSSSEFLYRAIGADGTTAVLLAIAVCVGLVLIGRTRRRSAARGKTPTSRTADRRGTPGNAAR
jgi:hypothetical protein